MIKTVTLASMVLTLWATSAQANIILLGPVSEGGTGFGSVLNILTLQKDPTEIGSVFWNGSADVLTGDAKNTSQTLTIQTLLNAGISTAGEFGIVYNVNQAGNVGSPSLNTQLNGFTVTAYSSAGATLGSWSYAGSTCPPTCFPPVNNGTGGAGYLFGFDAPQAAQLQVFFANPANRIGMSGSVSLANDGAENFFAYDRQAAPTSPVPEPTSMVLLGTGMLGLAAKVRRRRKV